LNSNYLNSVRENFVTQKNFSGEGGDLTLIEPGSGQAIRSDNESPALPGARSACGDCRHLHCQICEENSAPKQYSDFWICHRCGELNRRS
jgi:hypothetical protein